MVGCSGAQTTTIMYLRTICLRINLRLNSIFCCLSNFAFLNTLIIKSSNYSKWPFVIVSLWGKLVGSFPVMMFSRSDTSSMMRGSIIEYVFISINIFWIVTLASDILLRRRVLSNMSMSIS